MTDDKESIGEYVDIDTLVEWEHNPRHNKLAIDKVARSIERFGFASPIIAREQDRTIIAGHTRIAAARSLGLKTIPVRWMRLNKTEAELLALADNKLGEIADWDNDMLKDLLSALPEHDLSDIGWDNEELDEIINGANFDIQPEADNTINDSDYEDADNVDLERVKIAKDKGVYKVGDQYVVCGDCVEILKSFPDNSIDSIVCDPPYGIGFMKGSIDWDHSVPTEDWAKECFRVLKPGGHIVAFGATRAIHRMVCALEDEKFEIRDMINWLYFQGFPKSMDISKQIDKMNGRSSKPDDDFREYLRSAIKKANLTQKDIDRHCGTNGMVGHWLGRSQPEFPTLEHWEKMKEIIDLDDRYDEEIKRVEAEREVVGSKKSSLGGTVACGERDADLIEYHKNKSFDITKPATEEAIHWSGWGTNLKPACEPAILCRKPIEKGLNVSENVLKWGTGAINIDACRFGIGDPCWVGPQDKHKGYPNGIGGNQCFENLKENPKQNEYFDNSWEMPVGGRWPANIYQCAKPSRSERETGLEDLQAQIPPAVQHQKDTRKKTWEKRIQDPRAGAGRTASEVKNFHPTVKPTKLMAWLCRLLTPKGGIVLDTFLGSGTTGVSASMEGFKFIGTEMNPEYCDIALQRIKHATGHDIMEVDAVRFEVIDE